MVGQGPEIGKAHVDISGDGSGLNEDIVRSFDTAGDDVDRAGDEHGERYGEHFGDSAGDSFTRKMREKIGAGLRDKMSRDGGDAGVLGGSEMVKRFTERAKDKLADSSSSISEGVRDMLNGSRTSAATAKFADRLRDQIKDRLQVGLASALDIVDPAQQSTAAPQVSRNPTISRPVIAPTSGKAEAEALRLAKIQYRLESTLFKRKQANIAALARQRVQGEIRFDKIETDLQAVREKTAKAYAAYLKDIDTERARNEKRLAGDALKNTNSLWRVRLATAKAYAAYLADIDSERVKNEKRLNKESDDRTKSILADAKRVSSRAQVLANEVFRNDIKNDTELWKVRRTSAAAYAKYLKDVTDRKITVRGESIDTTGIERVASALGKGSRNNFLNTFGGAVGGVLRQGERLGSVFGGLFSEFQRGFAAAGDGAGFLTKTLSGLSSAGSAGFGSIGRGLASLSAAAPLAAGGLAAVLVAGSLVASVLSALTAIVVALASTIASGLAGALLAVTGLFAGVVAGAGLAVAAFTNLSKAQKSLLSTSFEPVKKQFSDLGKIVAGPLSQSFRTWGANITAAIKLATPVAEVMGKAFGQAGETLTKSLSGPGYKRFADQLERYLPNIVGRLADAFDGFGNAFTGIFAALTPLANRFANYLGDLGARFSRFVNSAKGQNSIADFANRAVESLKSLGGFIKEVGGFLSDLLFNPNSQAAGNSIFDSLTRSFEGFRAGLNDGSLQRWFASAIEFGSDLKEVVKGVAELFKALASDGTLESLGSSLRTAGDALQIFADVTEDVGNILSGVLHPIQSIKDELSGFKTSPLAKFLGVDTKLDAAKTALDATAGAVRGAMSANTDYADSLNKVTGAITAKTRAQILDNAGAADVLAVAGRMGISQRDLVDAISGNEKAIGRVSRAYGSAKNNLEALTPEGVKFGEFLRNNSVALKAQQGDVRDTAKANENFQAQLRRVNKSLGDLPKDVRLTVATFGAKVSRNELESLKQMFPGLTNKQLRVIVKELGTKGARQALRGLREDAEKTGRVRPNLNPFSAEFQKGTGKARNYVGKAGIPKALRDTTRGAKPNFAAFLAPFSSAGKNAKARINSANIPATLRNTTKGAKPNLAPFSSAFAAGLRGAVGRVKGAGLGKALADSTRGARPNLTGFNAGIGAGMNNTKARVRSADLDGALRNSTAAARANLTGFQASISGGVTVARGTASSGGLGVGAALKAGVIAGFAGAQSALAASAAAAVSAAISAARARAKVRSPSRETRYIGEMMGKGLAVGMDAQRKAVSAAGKRMAQTALSAAGGAVSGNQKSAKAKAKKPPRPTFNDPFAAYLYSLRRGAARTSDKKVRAEFTKIARGMDKDLKKALSAVGLGAGRSSIKAIDRQVKAAIKKASPGVRRQLTRFSDLLNDQAKTDAKRVDALNKTGTVRGATLADLAVAREKITKRLKTANDNLTAAIALRDDYRKAITEATANFGLLTTAVGRVVNGVEQAVTSTDIVANLQARFKKISDYQENLRVLLSQGLSNAAYKQLVDAGVDQGSAYVDALIKGANSGDISQVNDLVKSINEMADGLGKETSDRLYQAGVDSAQGIVDGLESVRATLEKTAGRLGTSIARAIRKSLGIKSPSRVLRADMRFAGDGLVKGLDDQTDKVSNAAARLSKAVSVNPRVRSEFAGAGSDPVSGNSVTNSKSAQTTHNHQWNVTTSGDPEAAAKEMLNEFTGRIG